LDQKLSHRLGPPQLVTSTMSKSDPVYSKFYSTTIDKLVPNSNISRQSIL